RRPVPRSAEEFADAGRPNRVADRGLGSAYESTTSRFPEVNAANTALATVSGVDDASTTLPSCSPRSVKRAWSRANESRSSLFERSNPAKTLAGRYCGLRARSVARAMQVAKSGRRMAQCQVTPRAVHILATPRSPSGKK